MRTSAFCLLLAAAVTAQQSGDFNRNYMVNFNGSFQSSYVTTNYEVAGTCFSNGNIGFTQTYITSAPNQPILWALASQGTVNWVGGLSANSVDIGPGGLQFILDGINVSPPLLGLLARTDGFGSFGLFINNAPILPLGTTIFLAMAHLAPASPDGFHVSQTHQLNYIIAPPVSVNCNANSVRLSPCDDCSYNQPLLFPFQFYGQTYNQIDIGSNGILGFGAGPGFEFDPPSFVNAPGPEIAPYSLDFNFNAGGCLFYYSDATTFEACWVRAPQSGTINSNTFLARIDSTGVITFEYGTVLDSDGSAFSQIITGLTPGNGLALGMAVDWSLGPGSFMSTVAPFESWNTGNLADVQTRQILITLDPMGNPANWIFL